MSFSTAPASTGPTSGQQYAAYIALKSACNYLGTAMDWIAQWDVAAAKSLHDTYLQPLFDKTEALKPEGI